MTTPKVFFSYSWTDTSHKEFVRTWADRLLADGIDVVIDVYDLKEGQDKYAYMERMITDAAVSHVLVCCDKAYKSKADKRKAGVGTESQIITHEIYERVDQTKFIPIVCEFDGDARPILPTFLQSKIWIDFSSPESVNENWERLIRHLYGKPLYTKPRLGQPPSYITTDSPLPTNNILARFNSLRQSVVQDRTRVIGHNRRDFLEACVSYADELRVRRAPSVESIGQMVLEDARKLKLVRDPLVDWVLLEGESTPASEFSGTLIEFLEKLAELKSRPVELSTSNETWFEAHNLFVYELLLYFVAALLRTKSYEVIREIYSAHYLRPTTDSHDQSHFVRFDTFQGFSQSLQSVLAREGRVLYSPAGELLKIHADRHDLPFAEVIQADLLTTLVAIVEGVDWYPQTIHYSPFHASYPFFVRAEQHSHFLNLSVITGIDDAGTLRSLARDEFNAMYAQTRPMLPFVSSYWTTMNMEKMDTLP